MRTDLLRPVVQTIAGQRPDKVAVLGPDRALTYRELREQAEATALALAAGGVSPGDAVAIVMGNGTGMVVAYLGVLMAGAVGVPVLAAATVHDVAFIVADCGAVVILTDEERGSVARSAAGDVPVLLLAATPAGLAGRNPTGDIWTVRELDLDEPAWILYTSGTTGRAKGVRLSQRNLLWPVAAGWAGVAGWTGDDLLLSPVPLAHVYGLDTLLAALCLGATVYVLPRFSAAQVIEVLEAHDVTVLLGVPASFDYLLRALGDQTYRRRTLRAGTTGAAPLPAGLAERVQEVLGAPLYEGYGATETSTALTLNGPGCSRRGTVGRAIEGVELRITDGEVVARGPGIMLGYHDRPEEQALTDGWYHTGDLGQLDADGFLTLTGRIKELIIRGGENISPAEIENLVGGHPLVADCAVVGLPHESLGEVPVLILVPGDTADRGDLEAEVLELCRARLAGFKVPGSVVFAASLPRSPAGKLQRGPAKDLAMAELRR